MKWFAQMWEFYSGSWPNMTKQQFLNNYGMVFELPENFRWFWVPLLFQLIFSGANTFEVIEVGRFSEIICIWGIPSSLCLVFSLSLYWGLHPLKIAWYKKGYALLSSQLIHDDYQTEPYGTCTCSRLWSNDFTLKSMEVQTSDPIAKLVHVSCGNSPVFVGNTPVFKYLDEPKGSLQCSK